MLFRSGKLKGDATIVASCGSMLDGQLAALATKSGQISDNGLTGTLTLKQSITGWADLLVKVSADDASLTVDAADMDKDARGTLYAERARIDAISHLSLTNDDDADRIAALLGKATDAAVAVGGMGDAQLNAVAAASGHVADEIGRAHV